MNYSYNEWNQLVGKQLQTSKFKNKAMKNLSWFLQSKNNNRQSYSQILSNSNFNQKLALGSKCDSKLDDDLSIVLGDSDCTLRNNDSVKHDDSIYAYNNFSKAAPLFDKNQRMNWKSTIKASHSNSLL